MIDPILPGKLALLYSKSLSGTVECVLPKLPWLSDLCIEECRQIQNTLCLCKRTMPPTNISRRVGGNDSKGGGPRQIMRVGGRLSE